MRRVVLDRNVWISGIIIPGSISSNLTTALIQGREQGITSNYILKEIERAFFRAESGSNTRFGGKKSSLCSGRSKIARKWWSR